jgi:hypothetical protein
MEILAVHLSIRVVTQPAGCLLAGLVGGSQNAEQELLDRPTLLASRSQFTRTAPRRFHLEFLGHDLLPLNQTTLSILFRTYGQTTPLD